MIVSRSSTSSSISVKIIISVTMCSSSSSSSSTIHINISINTNININVNITIISNSTITIVVITSIIIKDNHIMLDGIENVKAFFSAQDATNEQKAKMRTIDVYIVVYCVHVGVYTY